MQSRTPNWLFGPNFSFDSDSVFVLKNDQQGEPFPPTNSYIITESAGSNNIITEDGNDTITE